MEGTIVKIISNLVTVEANGNLYDCKPRGKFYHEKISPIVGDIVEIDSENKYILKIKPRKNELARPLISNVDSCIIVTSVKKPDLSLNLLDKMLANVIYEKIEPIICFTKTDLLSFKEKRELKKTMKYYEKIGIKVTTNKKLSKLTKMIAHKIVVLTGQTGAGKSTLLNKLNPNLNLETNEISKALGRGKHTTRHVELFKYKTSLIADTPGFSALELNKIPKKELKNTFIEFNLNCEYKDCNHQNEKNCEVKKMVNSGKILKSRYENYLKFMGELWK